MQLELEHFRPPFGADRIDVTMSVPAAILPRFMKLDLMTAPMPSVPRKFRMATTDKVVARGDIRRILDWPIQRLVMAHGKPMQARGKEALQQAFGWLLR